MVNLTIDGRKISVKEIEYLHNALKNRFERICEQNY